MLVLSTAISGSGRDEYLEKVSRYAEKHGKKIKHYNIGDLLFEQAEKIGVHLTSENILNANPAVINSIRSAVFENLSRSLHPDLKKYHAVFINAHALFYWKKVFSRAWDNYYVNQLKPDLFVTFIDGAEMVQQRLSKRKQWKSNPLSFEEILLWRNVEVEMTSTIADIDHTYHWIVPVSAPPSLLFRLLFKPAVERVYLAMPITNLTSRAANRKIDRLLSVLERDFVVFDPRWVEPGDLARRKVDPALYNQIVARDYYWFINQSHRLIAYFPKVALSAGLINEVREAHETNKEVWLIYPKGEAISPFLTYYCNKIFRSIPEFLKFLSGATKKRKRKRAKRR